MQPERETVRGARTAFSDIVSVTAARGGSIVLGVVGLTLVTHAMTPGQYALVAYVMVISMLMLAVVSGWTSTATVRYGREELESNGSIRATSTGRMLVSVPLALVSAAVVLGLQAVGALPSRLGWSLVLIAVGIGFAAVAGDHAVSLLEAGGKMRLTAVSLTLQRVAWLVGVALLVALSAATPTGVVLVTLITGWGLVLGVIVALWRLGVWPLSLDRRLLRRMLALAVPMIGFSISTYVIQSVDVVILGAFRPARDVGVYAIAYQGYGVLQRLATVATVVLTPLFVSLMMGSREHLIVRFYRRAVPQLVFVAATLAGLAAPVLSAAVPVVVGSRFAAAAKPLEVLLLAWSVFAAASFLAPILVLHELGVATAVINTIAAVVNVVGDLILIGVLGMGVIAPAIMTVVTVAVVAVGYAVVSARCLKQRPVIPVLALSPGVAGVVITLTVSGAVGEVAALGATVLVAGLVLVTTRPFQAGDADLIGKLDMPAPARRWALRILARL
jgi:O-antigen/teichoic acid export membrane protein